MKKYTCVKVVQAKKMTRKEAELDGLVKNPEAAEVLDEDGYKIFYKDGYESWSPKKAFEDGYAEQKDDIEYITQEAMVLLANIVNELEANNNKLTREFIDNMMDTAEVSFLHERGTTVCIAVLPTGHKLTGYAMVLDTKNNDNEIGRKVAYSNAREKLWETLGAIAMMYIGKTK